MIEKQFDFWLDAFSVPSARQLKTVFIHFFRCKRHFCAHFYIILQA